MVHLELLLLQPPPPFSSINSVSRVSVGEMSPVSSPFLFALQYFSEISYHLLDFAFVSLFRDLHFGIKY
jgi:hypothetical protein